MSYQQQFQERLSRQKDFFRDKCPRALFFYRGDVAPIGRTTLIPALKDSGISHLCNRRAAKRLIEAYLREFRNALASFYSSPSDALPSIQTYVGIGAVTAAMTGKQVSYSENDVWCEPNLGWDEIEELRVTTDGVWIEFALLLNQALMNQWDGDFVICPYIFRSPLDAAIGIRGSEMFAELYIDPTRCKRLIDWCCTWNISIRQYLEENINFPDGSEQGVWSTWLPPGSTFVNGDPVDMISRKMQQEFDAQFTGRMFSELSGGFFHHHALGLYQADQIAKIEGILVQEVLPDPGVPLPTDTILNDPVIAERVRAAAGETPLMLKKVDNKLLEPLLAVLRDGRTILWLDENGPEALDQARKVAQKVVQ
jgi:hypothetical protein